MLKSFKIVSDVLSFITSVYLSLLFQNYIIKDKALIIVSNIEILISCIFFILCIFNYKGYNPRAQFSRLSEITSLVNAWVLFLIVSTYLLFIFKPLSTDLNSLKSILVFYLSLLIIPSFFRSIFVAFSHRNPRKDSVFIVGLGEMGKSFLDTHASHNTGRFNFAGIFDDSLNKKNNYNGTPLLGRIEDLDKKINEYKIDRIIVAIRSLSNDKIDLIEKISKKNNVILNFLPSIESFKNDIGKLKEHSGIPLITRKIDEQLFFYRAGKRLMDIIISVLSLVLSLPFWIIIPVLIKRDSQGPILFKQERIGLNGKPFKMYKFRSMHIDSPKYSHCPTNASDPRITKIGRWIRKTSLDEIPQFINVFKGDMSMVGPRPEMEFIVNDYNTIEQKRLLVKPGLTGLWQVSPHRNTEINHNLEYDFYYIENQGFVLDIVILIMTALFAVKGITH